MKKCFKCGKEKETTEFYRHPPMADGYLGKCKECTKTDVNKNRNENGERYRAYDRFRYETQPHRKKALMENSVNYRHKYPNRYHAHTLLNNALRAGRIKKEPCEVCGIIDNIHAHHDNYYYPLSVRWLCAKHHREHHKMLNAIKRENQNDKGTKLQRSEQRVTNQGRADTQDRGY